MSCLQPKYSLLHPYPFADDQKDDLSYEYHLSANAVYLKKEIHFKVISSGDQSRIRITQYRLIRILNEQGFSCANVRIPFNDNSPISKIEARTILSNGSVYKLNEKNIYETDAFPQYIFYSDQKEKRFTMPAVEPGCLVEYKWVQEICQSSYGYTWEFMEPEPVSESVFILDYPTDCSPNIKIQYYPFSADSSFYENNTRVIQSWTMHDLPPFIPETSMPVGLDEVPHVRLSASSFKTWQDLGKWYWKMIENHHQPSLIIQKQAQKLISQGMDDYQKLQAVYEFTRDHIRYISIEIGMEGYQPRPPEEVLKNRYGDCKDMAGLMVSLAAALDLDVQFVLLSNWYHGKNDTSFISPNNFNHVITVARLNDSSFIFIDPTFKPTAFAQLPWYDMNRIGLIVHPEIKQPLVKVRNPLQNTNESVREWSIFIDEEGWIAGSLKLKLTGALGGELRNDILKIHPNLVEIWLRKQLSNIFQDVLFYDTNIEYMNDYDSYLLITGRFHSDALAIKNDNLCYFQPGKLSGFDLHKTFQELHRFYSIQLKYPFSISDRIYIQFPDSWSEISKNKGSIIPNPFGNYGWNKQTVTDGNIIYQRKFTMNRTFIPAKDYKTFLDLLYEVSRSDKSLLLFDSL